MEWTENKTKLLIEEFEKHPCLYDCKLEEYHNRDLRTVSWQRVAEACGSTGMIPASGILRTCGPTNGYFADRKKRTLFADWWVKCGPTDP